jgi:hypothetical protein
MGELNEGNPAAERRERGEADYRRLREMLDAGVRSETEKLSDRAYDRLADLKRISEVQREEQARADAEAVSPNPGMTHAQLLGGWPEERAKAEARRRPPTLVALVAQEREQAALLKAAKQQLDDAVAEMARRQEEVTAMGAGVAASESALRELDVAYAASSADLFAAYREKRDPDPVARKVEEVASRQAVERRKIAAAQKVHEEARAAVEQQRTVLEGAKREHALAELRTARSKFAVSALPMIEKLAKQLKPVVEEFQRAGAGILRNLPPASELARAQPTRQRRGA